MADQADITGISEVNFDTMLKVLLGVPARKEEMPALTESYPDFSC